MKGRIYKIVNTISDDLYIGSTVQILKNRFKAHKSNAILNKPGKLYEYMRSIGIDHFDIEIIEELDIDHISQLGKKEHTYYAILKPSLNMISPRFNIGI